MFELDPYSAVYAGDRLIKGFCLKLHFREESLKMFVFNSLVTVLCSVHTE